MAGSLNIIQAGDMTVKFRDKTIYDAIKLPCGGTAYFDEGSGCSHRCECGATVGSIGMSKHCREAQEKQDMWEKLGGEPWDFYEGVES